MSKRSKILLVDDSGTSLMMEKMVLQGGYDLICAKDGEEAVQKAEEELPDLILLDIVMPKMDGFEACRRIRELEATREIPIIMVSTRGEEHNVERGYELGCNDFLTKPFRGLELSTKVENALAGGSGEPGR